MSILLASGSPHRFRALGADGQNVINTYDQISRALAQKLGPRHADFLAEPISRGGAIDWYANFDSTETPLRLAEMTPERRDAAHGRIEELRGDILAWATTLRQSATAAERSLGDLLVKALRIPHEDHVWLVGDQPVLTFWGFVPDDAFGDHDVLRGIVDRRRSIGERHTRDGASRRRPESGVAALQNGPDPVADNTTDGATGEVVRRSRWPSRAALGALLALSLVAIVWQLLRACAIGLPVSLTGWIVDFCPATASPAVLAEIEANRIKQDLLQAEYAALQREAERKRQACVASPKPPPRPPSQEGTMIIPDDPDNLAFLEGCWTSTGGLRVSRTTKPVSNRYCFGATGAGTLTITYVDTGEACVGSLSATRRGSTVTIDGTEARCPRSGYFVPTHAVCRPGDGGVAQCDVNGLDDNGRPVVIPNIRFVRSR